jgi:nucleoside-diphosphate-sugar epimerase
MRVFVTGATGFVGTAVVRELIDAGHQVLGLARSDQGAAALTAAGAEVHRGTLEDLDSLRNGAATADGVIHTAFIHDFANFTAAAQTDRRAIETLGEALAGSGRPFIITSGTGILPPGQVGTEDSELDPNAHTSPRNASEGVALSFAQQGVRVSVMRLPPSVHGEGDHGFVPMLVGIARTKGIAAFVGDGTNRWAAVHRTDAARLYRLALESAPAGTRLHAVGEQGVPIRDVAEVIGRHLNLPVTAISREEADGHFGWLAAFVSQDHPASSSVTRKQLDWDPVGPGLIEDLDAGHYFLG